MNILIYNWRDTRHEWAGGGEVYVFELAKRWVKMGHTVNLFCGQDIRENLQEEEIIDGIKVFRKGGRYGLYLWAVWYYFKKFRKETDIIVDVQNGIPFFSVLYSLRPTLSIVYHVHGKQFFLELPFPINVIGYLIEKYIFPIIYKGTKIISISQTTKNDLVSLGFASKNISVVYCGTYDKKNKHTNNVLKFSQPTILYLGRIKKYKRVDMLVRIMPEILRKVKNARLLIAGWGTEASSIADMSMRSISRRKVKIIGPVSEYEKKRLLSRAWVFVNPSIGEGWSISVIEANLYGTPAVAFNVAGLSESIRHGKTGFLVEDENDLVEKICHVLNNSKTRKFLSINAQERARDFSWDNAAKQSINIITRLIK